MVILTILIMLAVIVAVATLLNKYPSLGGAPSSVPPPPRESPLSSAALLDGHAPRCNVDIEFNDASYHVDTLYEFPLVGAFYRWLEGGLTPNDLGPFRGWIIAQKNNPADPYAIAVYADKDGHRIPLGYIPKGCRTLHTALSGCPDRCMPVVGELNNDACRPGSSVSGRSWGERGRFFGYVLLMVGAHEVPQKNPKPSA